MKKEKVLTYPKPMWQGFSPGAYNEVEIAVEIEQLARQAGLVKKEHFSVTLTIALLDITYPGLNTRLRAATRNHLEYRTVSVMVFEGESAMTKMIQIIGDQKNPASCAGRSLRFRVRQRLLDNQALSTEEQNIVRYGFFYPFS